MLPKNQVYMTAAELIAAVEKLAGERALELIAWRMHPTTWAEVAASVTGKQAWQVQKKAHHVEFWGAPVIPDPRIPEGEVRFQTMRYVYAYPVADERAYGGR